MSLRHNMKVKPLLNREELLKSVVRDRELLSAYFQEIATRDSPTPVKKEQISAVSPKALQVQQRDSYDLFFESACISIKSLPPKLAAEAKSRISQIITEFELRAISEQEAQQEKEKRQMTKIKRIKTEPIVDTTSEIVYEFEAFT